MKLSGATRVEWMRERRAGVEARAGWRAFEEAAARVCGREPWERRVGVAQRGSLQRAGVGGLPLGVGETRMQLVLPPARGRLCVC